MELLPYILSQSVHCWCLKRLLNWLCILLLSWSCLWCLRVFLVEFFAFFRYKILSSANKTSLSTSFPIDVPFLSSSSLTYLARNSKTVLNKSEESGKICLVPDFRGNGFSFSSFNMMLAIGLSYMAFIVLRYILSICSLIRTFIMKDVEFSWSLFLHLLRCHFTNFTEC
jgi:hypothetical protein